MNNDKDNIIEQTKLDLLDDLELVEYLLKDRQQILETKKNILSSTIHTKELLTLILTHLNTINNESKKLSISITNAQSQAELYAACDQVGILYNQIRQQMSSIATLALATDWQSPSFSASLTQQAGSQEGMIYQSINDYKRDQHHDAKNYEKKFRKQYIRYPFINPVRIFAVNSGMAALTTIISFLIGQDITKNRSIVVGAHSYFENKILLKRFFLSQYKEVSEYDLERIKEIALKEKPAVWFFDSLCNDQTVLIPPLNQIIPLLHSIKNYHPYIVVDNTGLSITYQPFSNISFTPKQLIVWESLLKHHQFGLDRVNGGIIYASCTNASELYTYRDHGGTNISDLQVLSLPTPNKKILLKRLQRHQRNHMLLVNSLHTLLNNLPNLSVDSVISPHLQDLTQTSYKGTVCTLQFTPPYRSVKGYNRFLNTILSTAKQHNVNIVAGTSFGLPTTRIYIPASRKGQGIPFFRIAVGTEPYLIANTISHVFKEVISNYT